MMIRSLFSKFQKVVFFNFIQIYVESDYITFQYQDTNGIQYETKVKEMNDVIHVFQEFNMREINWINNFKWEKLDI